MASKLEQAARDLAQAAIQDTAGGILTQEITTELKAVAAATKSLEKSVDKGSSATSAELARIAKQSQSGLDKLTNSVNELNSLTKAQILQTAIVNLSPGGPCDASAPFNDTLQEFAQACNSNNSSSVKEMISGILRAFIKNVGCWLSANTTSYVPFKFDPSQQKHQEALINAIAEMTGLKSEIKMQEGRYAIYMK
jgi:hypothetical protein